MKQPINADGMIYKSMKKHRFIFLIIEILLLVALVWYFVGCSAYIINVFEGAVSFDEERFTSEVNTVKVGEPFELHRNDNITINDYALRPDSYWQEDKYEFSVSYSNPEETGIEFINQTTGTGDDDEADEVSSVMYVADIGGVKTLILAYPHQDIQNMDSIDGIFVDIPHIVKYNMAQCGSFEPEDELCEYMLDTRGLEMESEIFDLTFVTVLLLVVLYLAIKLFMQYKNYLYTPTYRQLAKYGEVLDIEAQIESELPDAIKEKKQLVCDNWILSEDTFKLKIVKNHRKTGTFRYTPENY